MGLKAISSLLLVAFAADGGSCQKTETPPEVTKDHPEVTLDGVDTSSLTTRERKEWSGYVTKLAAPCPNVGTVAQCITDKKTCAGCTPAAKYLLKSVRDGQTDEQIEKSFKNRFDAGKVREVRLDDSPSKGPENAIVTLVEWADFECPHCGMMEPILGKAFADHKTEARFVFKFMPLGGHPHGEISARAGFAALRQGKFWDMHDKMFRNQSHLEESDLLGYAKEIGLDIAKFTTDMKGNEAADRIARDKKLADELGIKGTPTIYINGRLFEAGANPDQALTDWLNLEVVLVRAGGAPVPVVTTTGAPTLLPTATASAPSTAPSVRPTATATATATASAKPAPTANKPK
jgi:protein-disulfide isomerase